MSSFILRTRFARRIPDPTFRGSVERHIFFASALDIPRGISKEANPREQRTDKSIWRDIRKHLLNQMGTPNTFHLKNKGITILASSVERLEDDRYEITIPEGGGIVDGGHTYDLVVSALEEIEESIESEEDPVDQFVKVEVLTGLEPSLVTEIAGGLNTAVQVQKYSLENLNSSFDWIKEALEDKPYAAHIAFRENETTAYDVRDILVFLDMFNTAAFPRDGSEHPVRAYTSKSSVLEHYVKAREEQYEPLRQILPDILELHDRISIEARDLHNQAGGRAGRTTIFKGRTRGEYEFHFTGQTSRYKLDNGALYPMLAAFRWMVVVDPVTGLARWDGGFESVLRVWRACGADLVRATLGTGAELGRKAANIGRSKNHWVNLYNIVGMRYMLMKQGQPS